MTAYKPYNFEDNEPELEQARELGLVSIGTQCPICNHVYTAQFADGDRRALQLALEKAEARAAELEAQAAQLREVLEEYHNRNYTHNDSEHELWLKSKAALSATPAQASPEQSRRTAYLAALEFINKIINMPMGPLNIADVEALRIIAKAAKRGER